MQFTALERETHSLSGEGLHTGLIQGLESQRLAFSRPAVGVEETTPVGGGSSVELELAGSVSVGVAVGPPDVVIAGVNVSTGVSSRAEVGPGVSVGVSVGDGATVAVDVGTTVGEGAGDGDGPTSLGVGEDVKVAVGVVDGSGVGTSGK